MFPFSSEISEASVGAKILTFLRKAQKNIIIASDKITSVALTECLLELCEQNPHLTVQVIWGDSINSSVEAALSKKAHQISCKQVLPKDGRMHNKFFLIDEIGTITGSPNATNKAFEDNIESFIIFYNAPINLLYRHYYKFLTSSPQEQTGISLSLKRELDAFNAVRNNPVNLWFAPIKHIGECMRTSLDQVKEIDMNMYLVSRGLNPGRDVINILEQQARKGASINIRVDASNLVYPFTRKAIDDIKNLKRVMFNTRARLTSAPTPLNFQFYAVEMRKSKTCFHDKLLMLVKKQRAAEGGNELMVIVGSAGLTTNVQENKNQENMVLIKDPHIYAFFKEHFNAIPNSPRIKAINPL